MAGDTKAQTPSSPEPKASDGQAQQGTPSIDPALEKRLKELEASLATERSLRLQAEADARKRQAEADRLKSRPQLPGAVQPQNPLGQNASPAQTRLQQMEQFANQAGKENMLLRELAARGLTEADVEGIEFDTPTELRLILDNLENKRQLEALKAGRKEAEPAIDTGGSSVDAAEADDDFVTSLYENSRKLGTTQEARWQRLQAIYLDPKKVVGSSQSE